MRFHSSILAASLLLAPAARAQDVISWLSKHANVQQIIKDKNSVDKPAYFSLIFPKDLPAQKDASISGQLSLWSTPSVNGGPSIELVQKTADKPQNTLTLGFENTWLADVGPKQMVAGVAVSRLSMRNETEVKYKRDKVAATEGLAAAARFTLIAPASAWSWSPYLIFPSTGQLGFKYEPRIGIEYDNAMKAKSGSPEGTTLRAYSEVGLFLYPFGRSLGHRFVLSFTYAFRHDLDTPEGVPADNHYLRTYSALIYVDTDRRFAFGVDRVSGQDPTNGFAEQALVRVSLKVRLKS